MTILLILALQAAPQDEELKAALDDVLAWPEAAQVELVIPVLPNHNFDLPFHRGAAIQPRFHGPEFIEPAVRDARRGLSLLFPGPWEVEVPASVLDSFSLHFRKGTSTAVVDVEVRDGRPVLVRVLAGIPRDDDWSRYGAGSYETFFHVPLSAPEIWFGNGYYQAGVQSPRSSWAGKPFPLSVRPSMQLNEGGPECWDLVWLRGMTSAESAAEVKRLEGLRWTVTPRKAMAIAARNLREGLPRQSTGATLHGASFQFVRHFPDAYIGAYNLMPFFADAPSLERLQKGEGVLGTWILRMTSADPITDLTVWIAADSGRVVYVYGYQ